MKTQLWMKAGGTAALAAVMLAGPAVSAAPVTYDFSVTATAGPLSGQTANGSFSFDSSIVPAGGGLVSQTDLLSSLAFTWDGIVYSAATANTGALAFNAAGDLAGAYFGTDCAAGSCTFSPGTENWAFFGNMFGYTTPGTPSVYAGSESFNAAPAAVPEPGSLALVCLALGGLGWSMRRRTASALPCVKFVRH